MKGTEPPRHKPPGYLETIKWALVGALAGAVSLGLAGFTLGIYFRETQRRYPG